MIAVVYCPYFGKLPNYFNLWLISASYNIEFDFVIITDDDTKYDLPSNVHIIVMEFEVFKEHIQKKLDFPISLDKPYKLCDFKPLYGYCLSSIYDNSNYSYWGHCDLDIIWGNINHFLPDNMEKYAKINYAAHFSIYRNNPNINEAFMRGKNKLNYQSILSNPNHFAFDEIGDYGINNLLRMDNDLIFDYQQFVAKVSPLKANLTLGVKYDITSNKSVTLDQSPRVFVFDKGRLYDYSLVNDCIISQEYAYIHLQKRKMIINLDSCTNRFVITHNSFIDYSEPTSEFIKCNQSYKFYLPYFSIKYQAGKRKLKRIIAIQKIKRSM